MCVLDKYFGHGSVNNDDLRKLYCDESDKIDEILGKYTPIFGEDNMESLIDLADDAAKDIVIDDVVEHLIKYFLLENVLKAKGFNEMVEKYGAV